MFWLFSSFLLSESGDLLRTCDCHQSKPEAIPQERHVRCLAASADQRRVLGKSSSMMSWWIGASRTSFPLCGNHEIAPLKQNWLVLSVLEDLSHLVSAKARLGAFLSWRFLKDKHCNVDTRNSSSLVKFNAHLVQLQCCGNHVSLPSRSV